MIFQFCRPAPSKGPCFFLAPALLQNLSSALTATFKTAPLFQIAHPSPVETKIISLPQNKTLDAFLNVFLKPYHKHQSETKSSWVLKNVSHFCAVLLEDKFHPDTIAFTLHPEKNLPAETRTPLMRKPPKHLQKKQRKKPKKKEKRKQTIMW